MYFSFDSRHFQCIPDLQHNNQQGVKRIPENVWYTCRMGLAGVTWSSNISVTSFACQEVMMRTSQRGPQRGDVLDVLDTVQNIVEISRDKNNDNESAWRPCNGRCHTGNRLDIRCHGLFGQSLLFLPHCSQGFYLKPSQIAHAANVTGCEECQENHKRPNCKMWTAQKAIALARIKYILNIACKTCFSWGCGDDATSASACSCFPCTPHPWKAPEVQVSIVTIGALNSSIQSIHILAKKS